MSEHSIIGDSAGFVSTISHEMRTPLTSIVGYVEMLQEGFGGELSTEQHAMVSVIDRNSRRLIELIEDVLVLSRLEANPSAMAIDNVKVCSLVSSVVQMLLPAARQAELEIELEVAEDVGCVRGDYGQLERALLNVVGNALKFTAPGGSIAVRSTVGVTGDVVLGVADNGIGIPKAELPQVFNEFFRASSAQNRSIQGTGLGLTIVKSIVERHGGSVTLSSELGVGTTVTVTLPKSVSGRPSPIGAPSEA